MGWRSGISLTAFLFLVVVFLPPPKNYGEDHGERGNFPPAHIPA